MLRLQKVFHGIGTSNANFLGQRSSFLLLTYMKNSSWSEKKGEKTPFFSSYSMLDMVLPSLIFKTPLPGMNSYLYFIDRQRNGNAYKLNYFSRLYNNKEQSQDLKPGNFISESCAIIHCQDTGSPCLFNSLAVDPVIRVYVSKY